MTSERGVITYPIPLYANVPIHAEYYKPRRFVISAVSLGYTTTITTSVAHDYVIAQEIRLIIPASFGCIQLNGLTGYVLSIPSTTQVVVTINSIGGDAFIASSSLIESAQIVAIGDINSGAINSNGPFHTLPYIPGSFIDISPL